MERIADCWYKNVCTQDCSSSCPRYNEMLYLFDSSGIPKSRRYPVELIPDDDDYDAFVELSQIKDNINQFIGDGKNLYIASAITGNGKTTWAIKLLSKYFDSIWAGNGFRTRALFVHVPTLLMQLKNFEMPLSGDYKTSLLESDVVVWDDIASTNISAYDYSQLLMYVDYRVFNQKSNIYTGNLITKQSLQKALGDKLSSRIWETSKRIIFLGKDKRNGQK